MHTNHFLKSLMLAVLFAGACNQQDDAVSTLREGGIGKLKLDLQTANGDLMNGTAFNGISFNGISFNGISFNGISFNGISFNGISFNGTELTGVNGADFTSLGIGTE